MSEKIEKEKRTKISTHKSAHEQSHESSPYWQHGDSETRGGRCVGKRSVVHSSKGKKLWCYLNLVTRRPFGRIPSALFFSRCSASNAVI